MIPHQHHASGHAKNGKGDEADDADATQDGGDAPNYGDGDDAEHDGHASDIVEVSGAYDAIRERS